MEIRPTQATDWPLLKQIRLAALLDAPTAFGVSYQTAALYSDEQWAQRASSVASEFWLAIDTGRPVGMIGASLGSTGRYNLIGMWVEPAARGTGVAAQLVAAVTARAIAKGMEAVYLDVSPDNARAVNFYLNQGFVFLDEWATLESHPHIRVQTMCWHTR